MELEKWKKNKKIKVSFKCGRVYQHAAIEAVAQGLWVSLVVPLETREYNTFLAELKFESKTLYFVSAWTGPSITNYK